MTPVVTLKPGCVFAGASLHVAYDSDTERWTVVLASRTTKEDVVVAWKQTEADAAAWAENYGARS
jgi:hypothetical protein